MRRVKTIALKCALDWDKDSYFNMLPILPLAPTNMISLSYKHDFLKIQPNL